MQIYKTANFKDLIGFKTYFLFDNYTILYWHIEEKQYVIAKIDPNRKDYTFSDYAQLPEYAPYELINGELVFMASPKNNHQKALAKLHLLLAKYVEEHNLGEIYFAPCDVHFDDENVLQPDLMYISVANLGIIQDNMEGAPDLTVEILSDGTKKDDYHRKMQVYAKFGVLEYWIIDTKKAKIELYENKNSEMKLTQSAGKGGSVSSKVLGGFVLEMDRLFA